MRFSPPLRFAREDFERMTRFGTLCGPDGTIGPTAFERMLRAELLRFLSHIDTSTHGNRWWNRQTLLSVFVAFFISKSHLMLHVD